MTWIEAIALGILQGLTEFLPISSSGHLVIAQQLLRNFEQPGVLFDVMLHFGTLISIFAFFWKDIHPFFFVFKKGKKKERRHLSLIILATIPTAIIALTFKDMFESLFNSITTVGIALTITGIFLFIASKKRNPVKGMEEVNMWDALIIGLAQGIAITPGISRSGFTISTAICKRIDPVIAARFSFLISIPAILGAILLEAKELKALHIYEIGVYITGTMVAAVTGYMAIAYLMHLLERKSLKPFAYYCLILGGLVILWSFLR